MINIVKHNKKVKMKVPQQATVRAVQNSSKQNNLE